MNLGNFGLLDLAALLLSATFELNVTGLSNYMYDIIYVYISYKINKLNSKRKLKLKQSYVHF